MEKALAGVVAPGGTPGDTGGTPVLPYYKL